MTVKDIAKPNLWEQAIAYLRGLAVYGKQVQRQGRITR
jgi:hypothetical protein